MNRLHSRVGMVAAVALFAGAAACSNKPQSVDAAFAADLKAASGGGVELAPRGNPAQVVVSPLEGGPQAAPKKAAPQQVNKPSTHAVTRVASRPEQVSAPTPAPAPEVLTPAPTPQPAPVQQAPAPTPVVRRPAPVQSQQRQPGTYKTEAEIFRQMPWIRP
jgi:outer membrane biosynthesis protein TonB